MRVATFVIALAFLLVAQAENARARTSGQLLPGCKELIATLKVQGEGVAFNRNEQTLSCWYYFDALQDVSVIEWVGVGYPALHACPPAESRLTQLIRVFIKFAEEHPERDQESAAVVFVGAIYELWPCPAPQ